MADEPLIIDATSDQVTCPRCRILVPIRDVRYGATVCPRCRERVA